MAALTNRMQTSSAVSAAHFLIQSAEAALPKQKKNSATAEFKHAMVAHKRRRKAREAGKGSVQLPQDVLVHIFGFLDMQSLVSIGLVCWSWNLAASENQLWQLLYASFFGNSDNSGRLIKDKGYTFLAEDGTRKEHTDWRESFKRAYLGDSSRKVTSHRGYCGPCKTIVWLNNMKCPNEHYRLNTENQQVKPLRLQQVVGFLIDDSSELTSSSDSDSDSDECVSSGLWAFPRYASRREPNSFIESKPI